MNSITQISYKKVLNFIFVRIIKKLNGSDYYTKQNLIQIRV